MSFRQVCHLCLRDDINPGRVSVSGPLPPCMHHGHASLSNRLTSWAVTALIGDAPLVAIFALAGPYFSTRKRWQLTSTRHFNRDVPDGFLIQSSQEPPSCALPLNLDELSLSAPGAVKDKLIDVEGTTRTSRIRDESSARRACP